MFHASREPRPPAARRRPSFLLVLLFAIAGTLFLAELARFSEALRPPLPVSSMLVRVPVNIATVPASAAVTVDQHQLGTTPVSANLTVGVHTVAFTRDGFTPLTRRIELVPGSPLDVQLTLSPVPGLVRVLTDTDEAQVSIDDHPLEEDDHQFAADDIAPGKHTLAISGKRAHASLEFELKNGAAPVLTAPIEAHDLTVAAISRFGDEATVIASDAAKIGLTHGPAVEAGPQPMPLPIADDESAELVGTGLGRRTIPLSHAAEPSLSVLAALAGGSMVVITGADDAVVSINGAISHRQPENGKLFFSGLAPGQYEVRAARPGGVEKSMTVTVAKDEQTLVPLRLAGEVPELPAGPGPAPRTAVAGPQGLARFVIKTPGARVTIRRTDVADPLVRLVITNSLRLPVGHWELHATAPGYKPYTTFFLVNDAGPADVFIKLEPESRE